MKIVIIEDEISACENLIYLLKEINANIEVVKVLDSVKSAVNYFNGEYKVDLILIDVHLGDGIAFDIFEQVEISIPIIFTTAYDQYAIKAFKVSSIDYLLKPINRKELKYAINKFLKNNNNVKTGLKHIHSILDELKLQYKKYKETFLVYQRDSLIPVKTKDIAYFNIDSGTVKGITHNNKSFIVDKKMEDLSNELDPKVFYRVNRQFIVRRSAVKKINYSFNGKFSIIVSPKNKDMIIISKAKATPFKDWMINY